MVRGAAPPHARGGGAAIPGRAGRAGRGARAVPPRLRPRRAHRLEGPPDRQGRQARRAGGGGPAHRPGGRGRRALRSLPRPDHLPDHRRAWADRVVRRPCARSPGARQVPERAGDAALPQGLDPLPAAGGAKAPPHAGRRGCRLGGGGGLHGRHRLPAGGDRRGRAARHRAHRGADGGALAVGGGARALLRRRRRGPARRPQGDRPGAAAPEAGPLLPLRPADRRQGPRRGAAREGAPPR